MTPTALRTMRAAMHWSMRDCASAAGVALGTILAIEKGVTVSTRTLRRVRAAFGSQGVSVRITDAAITVRIAATPPALKAQIPPELLGLAYVSIRPRADGTHRVLFEVPARLRPPGWPATRPLPLTHERRGNLGDKSEVAAIKVDARRLVVQLEEARRAGRPLDRR